MNANTPPVPDSVCNCIKVERWQVSGINPENCWGETRCRLCRKHIHWGVRRTGTN